MSAADAPLTVVVSPTAIEELHGIWRWNAEQYSSIHAELYLEHLERHVASLANLHARGHAVAGRRDLRYLVVRRKSRGHGHVIVYRTGETQVDVLHVFHSAQNWQGQLASDTPSG